MRKIIIGIFLVLLLATTASAGELWDTKTLTAVGDGMEIKAEIQKYHSNGDRIYILVFSNPIKKFGHHYVVLVNKNMDYKMGGFTMWDEYAAYSVNFNTNPGKGMTIVYQVECLCDGLPWK